MNGIVDEWVEKAEDDFLLNDYAVDIRYPGEEATKEEARAAVKAMRTVRTFSVRNWS